jgi:TldD protein
VKRLFEYSFNRRKFLARSVQMLALSEVASSGIFSLASLHAKDLATNAFDCEADDLTSLLRKASRQRCDFAEIFLEQRISRRFKMVDDHVEKAQIELQEGVGIRVVDGIRSGYAYVNGFDRSDVKGAAERASKMLERGSLKTSFQSLAHKPEHLRSAIVSIRNLEDIKDQERFATMKAAITAAKKSSNLIRHIEAAYDEDIRRIMVANSYGIFRYDYQPLIYFTVTSQAEEGRRRHRGQARLSHKCGFEIFDKNAAEITAMRAAEESVQMLGARDAVAGAYPVILAPGAGGVLFHEAVGHGLEGDSILQEASYYCGKLGTQVASPLVTLFDNGQLIGARGSADIDDEGNPTQSNTLIEKGILRKIMTDSISAKQLGLPLSGNARRDSYRNPPLVRMTNTYIESGPDDPDKIISDTSEGLYCKSFTGGEVDTASGNFTFTVREAYQIKNGRIQNPVRGATLIGQGSDVLMSIDRVGSDFDLSVGTCGKGQWVPVSFGQPTLRIGKITVGGTN